VCRAVTGADDAAATLYELERSGLPIMRAHRGDRRLRCHPLLRDALRAELHAREAAHARRLHRRAAAWFDEHGDAEAAIEHALAAHDTERAAQLLWRIAPSLAWDERTSRLEDWLERLPARRIETDRGLAALAALCALVRGRAAHAERWVRVAENHVAVSGAPEAARAGLGLLRAATVPDDVAAMRRTAATAAAGLPDGDPWSPLASWLQGTGAALAGDEQAAGSLLERGTRAGIAGSPGLAALCEAQMALVDLCNADWEHGACLAERARGRIAGVDLADHPIFAVVAAVAAFARAHRGRFEEARADVALVRRLIDAEGAVLPPWAHVEVEVALARAQLRLSAIAEGRARLGAARRLARELGAAPALDDWIAEAQRAADAATSAGLPAHDTLTAAELRVLRRLPSHLSFREIGAELCVSPNTIKTQAHAVYRKLGATSRSIAVGRARALGLLDGTSSQPGDVARAGAS
jgi:LuxR family transcriptional regulator, maltose regulon positive regulatory protein